MYKEGKKKSFFTFFLFLIKFLFRIYPFLLLTLLFVFLLVLQFKQITKLIEHIKNDRYVDFLYVSMVKEKIADLEKRTEFLGLKRMKKFAF